MMKYLKRMLFILVLSISNFSLFGQHVNEQAGLKQTLHESGKIYVVVAVLAVIFIGIIYFLIRTELKIKKLEEEKGN